MLNDACNKHYLNMYIVSGHSRIYYDAVVGYKTMAVPNVTRIAVDIKDGSMTIVRVLDINKRACVSLYSPTIIDDIAYALMDLFGMYTQYL